MHGFASAEARMQIGRKIILFLTIVLAVSGCVIAARAIFGPFRLVVSVANPINPEVFLGLSAMLLLILRAHSTTKTRVQKQETNPWALPVLFAAGLGAWVWTFGFPFVADDYTHIANGLRAGPGDLANLFILPAKDRFFRPFSLLAYAAQARVLGTGRMGWHAFSFALHLVNSALVYAMVRKLGHRTWPSLAAALFFLLHGSRPEAVAWVAAQFDLWAAFFFFLSLLAFLKQMETGGRPWQIASLSLFLFALLSKESAYVLPLVLGLIVWLDDEKRAQSPYFADRRTGPFAPGSLRLLVPPFILAGIVFLYRWRILNGIGGYQMVGTGTPFFFSVSLFRTGKALLLRLPAILVFPINWTRAPQWWLVCSLIAAIAGLALFVRAKLSRRRLWLALGFMLAAAAPVHQFLLIGPDLEKSRVLYLPSAGFALLLAAGLDALAPRIAMAAACAILVFQTAALEHNLSIWRSVGLLAERTCQTVARAAASQPQSLAVSDVPNTLDGVYFLHTGLRECVEWAAGRPLAHVSFASESAAASTPLNVDLRWDDAQRAFVAGNSPRIP